MTPFLDVFQLAKDDPTGAAKFCRLVLSDINFRTSVLAINAAISDYEFVQEDTATLEGQSELVEDFFFGRDCDYYELARLTKSTAPLLSAVRTWNELTEREWQAFSQAEPLRSTHRDIVSLVERIRLIFPRPDWTAWYHRIASWETHLPGLAGIADIKIQDANGPFAIGCSGLANDSKSVDVPVLGAAASLEGVNEAGFNAIANEAVSLLPSEGTQKRHVRLVGARLTSSWAWVRIKDGESPQDVDLLVCQSEDETEHILEYWKQSTLSPATDDQRVAFTLDSLFRMKRLMEPPEFDDFWDTIGVQVDRALSTILPHCF